MTPSQGGELAIIIFCAVIYLLYHWWVFFYDYQPQGTIKVMRAARNARRVWARSILADDKETVTGTIASQQGSKSFPVRVLCTYLIFALVGTFLLLCCAYHLGNSPWTPPILAKQSGY